MTIQIESFSPSLINHFDQLKSLFKGEKELAAIDRLPKSALIRSKDYCYFGRWQVAWILITSPLTAVVYIFLKIVACALDAIFIRSLANRCHIMAAACARNLDYLYLQSLYGNCLWVPSTNEYQVGLADVYNQSPVKREDITDSLIEKKLHRLINKISYNRIGKGLCFGGVNWFNYLLLKKLESSPNDFDSYQRCLVGVAKQFETGQPRQAALLQSIYGLEKDLLGLTETELVLDHKYLSSDDCVLGALNELENGVYKVFFPKHAISYIKWNEKQYFWDPGQGLIFIQDPRDFLKIIQHHTKDLVVNKLGEKVQNIAFVQQKLQKI